MILSSVHNALQILRILSDGNREFGISELSAKLGLAKSTVFRLLQTLSENRLVQQNEENRKYRLGLSAFEMGFAVYHSHEIRIKSYSLLMKLMQSMRKVVRLGTYDRGDVVYLCILVPEGLPYNYHKIGNRNQAFCTSLGKVLLSHQSEEEISRVVSGPLKAYTPKTITDPIKLSKELEEVRAQGYAVSKEEYRVGNQSVAVPVYNDEGNVVASIAIGVPGEYVYGEKLSEYVKIMKSYSRLITEKL